MRIHMNLQCEDFSKTESPSRGVNTEKKEPNSLSCLTALLKTFPLFTPNAYLPFYQSPFLVFIQEDLRLTFLHIVLQV
jgi:hypothetical protein